MLLILKNNAAYREIRTRVYSTILTSVVIEQLMAAGAYTCLQKGVSFEALVQLAVELKNLPEACTKVPQLSAMRIRTKACLKGF